MMAPLEKYDMAIFKTENQGTGEAWESWNKGTEKKGNHRTGEQKTLEKNQVTEGLWKREPGILGTGGKV